MRPPAARRLSGVVVALSLRYPARLYESMKPAEVPGHVARIVEFLHETAGKNGGIVQRRSPEHFFVFFSNTLPMQAIAHAAADSAQRIGREIPRLLEGTIVLIGIHAGDMILGPVSGETTFIGGRTADLADEIRKLNFRHGTTILASSSVTALLPGPAEPIDQINTSKDMIKVMKPG